MSVKSTKNLAIPILVVDGYRWDVSNLTCADSSHTIRASADDFILASYPKSSEVPACLDVQGIFDKLKAANLLKLGRLANPQLASLSPSQLEQKKTSSLPSPIFPSPNRPRSIQVENRNYSSNSKIRSRPDESLRREDDYYERQEEYRRQEDAYERREDGYRRNYQEQDSYHRNARQTQEKSSNSHHMRHRRDDQHDRSYESSPSVHRYENHSPPRRSSSRDRRYEEDYSRGERDEERHHHHRHPQHQQQQHQDYDDDVDDEEEEPETEQTLVEVTPGNYVHLRGSAETWDAVQDDRVAHTTCFCCTWRLVCIDDADMIMCPGCQVISPVTDGIGGGGLGLGMREEDAAYELNRLRREQQQQFK